MSKAFAPTVLPESSYPSRCRSERTRKTFGRGLFRTALAATAMAGIMASSMGNRWPRPPLCRKEFAFQVCFRVIIIGAFSFYWTCQLNYASSLEFERCTVSGRARKFLSWRARRSWKGRLSTIPSTRLSNL